jgi:hypothetical protein
MITSRGLFNREDSDLLITFEDCGSIELSTTFVRSVGEDKPFKMESYSSSELIDLTFIFIFELIGLGTLI